MQDPQKSSGSSAAVDYEISFAFFQVYYQTMALRPLYSLSSTTWWYIADMRVSCTVHTTCFSIYITHKALVNASAVAARMETFLLI